MVTDQEMQVNDKDKVELLALRKMREKARATVERLFFQGLFLFISIFVGENILLNTTLMVIHNEMTVLTQVIRMVAYHGFIIFQITWMAVTAYRYVKYDRKLPVFE